METNRMIKVWISKKSNNINKLEVLAMSDKGNYVNL